MRERDALHPPSRQRPMTAPAGHLSASWLAVRLGTDPIRIMRQRSAGELLGFRPAGSTECVFPAWQFDPEGRPLPAIERILTASRRRGLSDERLVELLDSRSGLRGDARLVDLVRSGAVERVLAEIEAAQP